MFYRIGICLVVLPLLLGCGESGPAKVSGKVSLDGQPIEEGRISFLPQGGDGTTAEAVIAGGAYTAEVPPGKKVVQIIGMRVTGERPAYAGDPNSPMIKTTENFVPAKFNDKSELEREITGSTTMDFELKSSS